MRQINYPPPSPCDIPPQAYQLKEFDRIHGLVLYFYYSVELFDRSELLIIYYYTYIRIDRQQYNREYNLSTSITTDQDEINQVETSITTTSYIRSIIINK